jgi:hypothetical protein
MVTENGTERFKSLTLISSLYLYFTELGGYELILNLADKAP